MAGRLTMRHWSIMHWYLPLDIGCGRKGLSICTGICDNLEWEERWYWVEIAGAQTTDQ